MGGVSRVIGPGEKLVVSPGTPHRFWNETDDEVRAYIQFRPALRLLNYFEALFGALGDGKRINPLKLADVLHEYLPETCLSRPPLPVQKGGSRDPWHPSGGFLVTA